MPQRRGLAGGINGMGGALQDLGTLMQRQKTSDADAVRNDQLERARTADNLIASGKLEPKDRDAFIRGTYTGPSVEGKVSGMLADITKAPSPDQVPSRVQLDQFAKTEGLPVQFGAMPGPQRASVSTDDGMGHTSSSGGDTLPSTPMGPISRDVNTLMAGRDAKLKAFGPTRVVPGPIQGTGADAQATEIPQKVDTDTGEYAGQTPIAIGPTAGQKGAFEGTADAAKNALTAPGQIDTAAKTTAATTQAGLDVQNAPKNVAGDANRQAAIATAVDMAKRRLAASGIPPELADSFVHHTSTGRAYFSIDPSTPTDIRDAAMKQLASDPALKGSRFVTKEQNNLLGQIDGARSSLSAVMDAFKGKLPKSPSGRVMGGPKNTLAIAMQSDPQLAAAYQTFYGPTIEIFRASMGNIPGLRMTQPEINRAQEMVPRPTDTWDDAVYKTQALAKIFEHAEQQMLGK